MHVMIDLETLGTSERACILAIGAVKFRPYTTQTGAHERFYVRVDPTSACAVGQVIEPATCLWWFSPKMEKARQALLEDPALPLSEALHGLYRWYGEEPMPTWAMSPQFDLTILQVAYRLCNMAEYIPWRYKDARDVRTLKTLFPHVWEPFDSKATDQHHALADAIMQAEFISTVLAMLPMPVEKELALDPGHMGPHPSVEPERMAPTNTIEETPDEPQL